MDEAQKLASKIDEWENDPDAIGCWSEQLSPDDVALIIRALKALKD